MLEALLKLAAPLVLVLALLCLGGVASMAAAFAATVTVDSCCGKETEEPQSGNEGACDDPDCRCPSCTVAILNLPLFLASSSRTSSAPLWMRTSGLPSDYIRTIDYPPESF